MNRRQCQFLSVRVYSPLGTEASAHVSEQLMTTATTTVWIPHDRNRCSFAIHAQQEQGEFSVMT